MSDLVREIALGLARADTDLAIPADALVMLVRNRGAIPGLSDPVAVAGSRAGFDLVLLDDAGRPTHFCKCRPPGDPRVAREVEVVRAAGADASLAAHLPQSALASTERLAASVSPYEEGSRYDRLVVIQSTDDWSRAVEEIAAIVERVARAVAVHVPEPPSELRSGGADVAHGGLERLSRLALPPRRRDALARSLLALEGVRAVPQHGNLRPSNVLRRDPGWLLLGLGGFGRSRTPLHDLFHLLRASHTLRRARREDSHDMWIEALRDPSEDSTAARAILRRAVRRHALSAEAALGALAFYLIDDATPSADPGEGDSLTPDALDELSRLAELLLQGAGPVAFGLAAA